MTPVSFLLTSDVDDSALESVTVRVYSEDGTVLVTSGVSDEDGALTLDLDDATYWVRFFKSGYSFPSRALIVVDVLENNTFEVEGTDLDTHPSALDVNLCRVSGRVVTGAATGAPKAVLKFTLSGVPRVVGGRAMLPTTVYSTTDASGWFEQDLVRNGIYELVAAGMEDASSRVRIPDYPWVDLAHLLFPYVKTVEFSETDIDLEVAEEAETEMTVTLASRLVLPYDLDGTDRVYITDYLDVTIADTDVATMTMDEDGVITITGVAAGSTTITITEKDVVAARQPAVAPSVETVTITVT